MPASPRSPRYNSTSLARALTILDLYERARPALKELAQALSANAHLAVLYQGQVLYLGREETAPSAVFPSIVGRLVPAHCTALGKVLLAHLPPGENRRLPAGRPLERRTARTITSVWRLEVELAGVLARGYAVDNEELHEGVMCVGAPVRDHTGEVVAAISVSLLKARVTEARIEKIAQVVVRAARRAKGSILMVDQNYRWRPHTRALRRAIREGGIGRVASASYEFRQNIVRPTTDAWREEMPHPYLHDIAIHHFDLLRACTGQECTEVLAVPVRPPWSWYRGLPALDAILTFDQGISVSYTGTMVARGFTTPQDGIITIVGEDGTLRLEADGQVRWYRDTQVEVVPPEAMPFTDTAYALREFLATIREARRPETDVEDNIRSLAMVAAAVTSVEKRQPVAVAPLVAEALVA